MEIKKIVEALKLNDVEDAKEILGGADSAVWKLRRSNGDCFALRVIPVERHSQFLREESFMKISRDAGIPVPMIHFIKKEGPYSVMLMDWAVGETLLSALLSCPENAYSLGLEFGSMQSRIHAIPIKLDVGRDEVLNWLTPFTEMEKQLMSRQDGELRKIGLLHLDYHPLNVLTNGKSITGVIDWANACINDPKYDVARTFSILQIEANRLKNEFGLTDHSVTEFERGWMEGYREKGGMEAELSSELKAWAGFRMRRDLIRQRSEEELRKIEGWANSWLMYKRE